MPSFWFHPLPVHLWVSKSLVSRRRDCVGNSPRLSSHRCCHICSHARQQLIPVRTQNKMIVTPHPTSLAKGLDLGIYPSKHSLGSCLPGPLGPSISPRWSRCLPKVSHIPCYPYLASQGLLSCAFGPFSCVSESLTMSNCNCALRLIRQNPVYLFRKAPELGRNRFTMQWSSVLPIGLSPLFSPSPAPFPVCMSAGLVPAAAAAAEVHTCL